MADKFIDNNPIRTVLVGGHFEHFRFYSTGFLILLRKKIV
jgi:hypothetical protein